MSFDEDEFEDAGEGTALSLIADAFEELSSDLIKKGKNQNDEMRLKPFCDACSLVSVLFGSLGLAFKFAEMEYTSKVCLFHQIYHLDYISSGFLTRLISFTRLSYISRLYKSFQLVKNTQTLRAHVTHR